MDMMMIVTHLAMVHHHHDIVYKNDITHSSSSVKITNILSHISIIYATVLEKLTIIVITITHHSFCKVLSASGS